MACFFSALLSKYGISICGLDLAVVKPFLCEVIEFVLADFEIVECEENYE